MRPLMAGIGALRRDAPAGGWLAAAPPRWTPREWLVLGAIVTLGTLLRIACAWVLPSPLESDYLGYWTIANNVHAGRGILNDQGQPTAFLSLGYPLFLAGVFKVTGASILAVKATNILLSVVASILFYVAARNLFRSTLVAALSVLILAVYAEAIVYVAYVAKENLMLPLMAAQWAAASSRARGGAGVLAALGFGLATGGLAMVGNAGLALMPALLVVLAFSRGGIARLAGYLAVAVVAGSLAVAPLMMRNHAVFGAYVLNNNGGFNLYIGNNPNAVPFFQSITETPLGPQWQALYAELGERGVDVLLRQIAIRHIMQNPVETLELMGRKAIAFWWPPTHSGVEPGGRAEQVVRFAWLVQFCLIGLLFAASLLRWPTYPLGVSALWLAAIGYTAVHMIFYVVYRYRLPIMPFLCIGAAVSLEAALRGFVARRQVVSSARPG